MASEERPKPKYRSLRQFYIGVTQVDEPLSQGEQCVLNCLAAHCTNFKDGSGCHPGNEKLMHAARCETRQGVQYLLKKLKGRGLIEQTGLGSGGRHVATVFRIRVEDDRFHVGKPPSLNLAVLVGETAKYGDGNRQVVVPKTAETAKSELAHSLNSQSKRAVGATVDGLRLVAPPSTAPQPTPKPTPKPTRLAREVVQEFDEPYDETHFTHVKLTADGRRYVQLKRKP